MSEPHGVRRLAETQGFVVVRVGPFRSAWPVEQVREVRLPVPLVREHGLPLFVDGALRVRRALVPVVDLRRRWLVEPLGDAADRIILTRVSPFVVGFLVDDVLTVLRAPVLEPSSDLHLPRGIERTEVRAVIALPDASGGEVVEAFVIAPATILNDRERAALGSLETSATP